MSNSQSAKQPVVTVKPRAGNKSAGIIRSIQLARVKRKFPISIGSVDCTASLETGEGIRMNPPYTLADLTVEDRQKIADWLTQANSATPKVRPGFSSLNAKLDRVLELMLEHPSRQSEPVGIIGPASEVTTNINGALDRLEQAIADALSEVRTLYTQHAAAGIKLTNVGHAQTTPKNPANAMDQLQARVNYLRFETLLQFQKGCQRIGIIKKGAGER